MKQIKVLALTRYGALGASSRIRCLQYLPFLNAAGINVQTQPLFDDKALLAKYQHRKYGMVTLLECFAKRILVLLQHHKFDVLWIEKESLPWWPLWLEATLLSSVPYVLDYDDAVFHNYDQHRLELVRFLFGKRLDRLMAKAEVVICGNDYLAQRAKKANALRVEVLPTVIDLSGYPEPKSSPGSPKNEVPSIVWIGSPSTVRYLEILHQPLQRLASRAPFVLRVIGAKCEIPGVRVECVSWSESSEVREITDCDVGVMPLANSSWELGKCGYKLIQYMGCSLPVVASPVGVNTSIVEHRVNGFLAEGNDDWVTALELLLTNPELRITFGCSGRKLVEQKYCVQVACPRLAEWLRSAAKEG